MKMKKEKIVLYHLNSISIIYCACTVHPSIHPSISSYRYWRRTHKKKYMIFSIITYIFNFRENIKRELYVLAAAKNTHTHTKSSLMMAKLKLKFSIFLFFCMFCFCSLHIFHGVVDDGFFCFFAIVIIVRSTGGYDL